MTSIPRFVAVVLCCFVLAACEDDWGETIERFVDDEVNDLSTRIAEEELRLKWFDYFNSLPAALELALTTTADLHVSALINNADLNTFLEREQVLRRLDTADTQVIEALRVIESLERELVNVDGICDAPLLLAQLDVTAIGAQIAAGIVVPDPEWYVEINCSFSTGGERESSGNSSSGSGSSCLEGIMTTIASLWGYSKQSEQRDKANRAKDKISSRVVSATQVDAMSRRLCRHEQAKPSTRQALVLGRDAIASARTANRSVARALLDLRHAIEVKQMPMLLQKVQDATGVAVAARELLVDMENARLHEDVEQNRKDLAEFERHFLSASTCAEILATSSTFAGVLAEKRAQLQAALSVPGRHVEALTPFLQLVEAADTHRASKTDEARVLICQASAT